MANEKILIIDDDDDLVLAMRLPLEAAGYKVSRAASGEEGLEKSQRGQARPHHSRRDDGLDDGGLSGESGAAQSRPDVRVRRV